MTTTVEYRLGVAQEDFYHHRNLDHPYPCGNHCPYGSHVHCAELGAIPAAAAAVVVVRVHLN